MPWCPQTSKRHLSLPLWVVLVHSCKSVSYSFFYSQVSSAMTRKRPILVKSISNSTENLANREKGNYTIESNQKILLMGDYHQIAMFLRGSTELGLSPAAIWHFYKIISLHKRAAYEWHDFLQYAEEEGGLKRPGIFSHWIQWVSSSNRAVSWNYTFFF